MTLQLGTEGKAVTIAAGGVERVVAAMAAHVAHAGVQEHGCTALSNLTCLDGTLAAAQRCGRSVLQQRFGRLPARQRA